MPGIRRSRCGRLAVSILTADQVLAPGCDVVKVKGAPRKQGAQRVSTTGRGQGAFACPATPSTKPPPHRTRPLPHASTVLHGGGFQVPSRRDTVIAGLGDGEHTAAPGHGGAALAGARRGCRTGGPVDLAELIATGHGESVADGFLLISADPPRGLERLADGTVALFGRPGPGRRRGAGRFAVGVSGGGSWRCGALGGAARGGRFSAIRRAGRGVADSGFRVRSRRTQPAGRQSESTGHRGRTAPSPTSDSVAFRRRGTPSAAP